MNEKRILLPYMDPKVVQIEIEDFILHHVLSRGSTGCVMGFSGGVDSSVTGALVKSAFDHYNKNHAGNLELRAYMLPSSVNNPNDTRDGVRMAEHLGVRYDVLNIEATVNAFRITNPEAFENKFDQGNMTSRIRANVLHTKSATEHKLVCGTGNKDEDFAIGYYTLFGDGAVHMSPIGGLSKRLVREIGAHMGLPDDLVKRIPTAGLEIGQTDFHDLGYDYDVVELVSEGLSQGFTPDELYHHSQIEPLIKKQIGLLDEPRYSTSVEVVDDIIRRHKTAIGKASLVSPPIAPITLEYR